MEGSKNQSRREFLGKTLAAVAVAALNPISVLLTPKELYASGSDQPLSTNVVVDLSKYPALKDIDGSVAISLKGTNYLYGADIQLPFRFILTKTATATYTAVAGYCSHQLYALDPYDGTVILCPNPDPGHGSEFSASGTVLKKPSKHDLETYHTTYDSLANTVTLTVPNLAVGDGTSQAFAPELMQNFPNPVKESTVIRFKLHYFSKVSLTVTDALGHVIAILTDGTLPDGDYSFTFDASIWASGIYFYHLNVGGEVLTKEMVVVK